MKNPRKLICLILSVSILFCCAQISCSADTYKVGDLVAFGSFPQDLITDESICTKLNAAEKQWVSYGFYTSETGTAADGRTKASDICKYADVTLDGKQYRGITFSKYRPTTTVSKASDNDTGCFQYTNGFRVNTVYWFSCEKLTWRVLTPKRDFCFAKK